MADYNELLLDQKRTESLILAIYNVTREKGAETFRVEDLEVRLEMLEGYWMEYTQRDRVVQRASDAHKERTYFKGDTYKATQLNYLTAKSWFKSRIKSLLTPAAAPVPPLDSGRSQPPIFSTQASLEKLRLPRFDGLQRDWEAFKEKFTSLIINDTSMDPIIKFQHLTNCLEGEAAEKLKGIKLIGANLVTAWDTLCKRYDNKYLRFSLQMQALVQLPSTSSETVKHLSQLLNTVNESINTFTALSRPVDKWDDLLVYFIESKLALSTRLDWVKEVERKKIAEFPKYADIKSFLEDRIRTLDLVESDVSRSAKREDGKASSANAESSYKAKEDSKNRPFRRPKYTTAHVASRKFTASQQQCSFCNGEHFLGYCQKFAFCTPEQRNRHVVEAKLCRNCLNSSHTIEVCQSKGRCLVCSGKHHTKLHPDHTSSSCSAALCEQSEQTTAAHAIMEQPISLATFSGPEVLLSTACVTLQSASGQSITVRALLDSGAEECFLTEHIAQTLLLTRNPVHVSVSGVGGETTAISKSRVAVILKSASDANFCFKFSALILKKLTAMIPRSEIRRQPWPHLSDLQLADPHFDKPARIDCILNSEAYAAALLPGIRRGSPGMPIALRSVFGWVIMGAATSESSRERDRVSLHYTTADSALSAAVARFWEIEEVPTSGCLSPSEEVCYNHFRSTHTRNEEGRFVVRLPFIQQPQLSDTRCIAEACLKRTERRFTAQPDLAKAYGAFMDEYLNMGHMEHPVVKKDGSKKIRVVFNASQKNSSGFSLNSFLHTGPKLQEDVLIIIVRWSFLPLVFTCDIVKMFRQFLVHSDDVDFQRIVWRSSPNLPIDTFRLRTVTYGTACAPFLANACMLRLSEEEEKRLPAGADVLKNGRYVDDLFAGGDTLEEALSVRRELLDILSSAGMSVGKWAANHCDLLTDLGIQEIDLKGTSIEEQDVVTTLGLRWLSAEDAFCFKISQLESSEIVTKRSILSEIARLYDPVGWLSPVIVAAKILLQNLWMHGFKWDDPVSESTKRSWLSFRQELRTLEQLRIPRWTGSYKSSEWELHCFCDASERAYAAALYVVLPTENGISVRLMTAKSKVAPIKVISLPKLELCGALLLARLASYVLSQLDRRPTQISCWSDSRVALAWLQAHPSRWRPFIANRVSEITTTLPNATWRHVPSADNPADLATRGISPTLLQGLSLWWQGPDWLRGPPEGWPNSAQQSFTTDLESRKGNDSLVHVAQVVSEFSEWLCKFSSIDKLIRILTYIKRWQVNSKIPRGERRLCWLSAAELVAGRNILLKLLQKESFASEIQALESQKYVSRSSSICRLSPFLDKVGLLRVGGRLQNSFLSESERHPIILPSKHHVTRLMIQQAHLITLHGGPSLVQSHLARQYWLVRGRNTIRNVVRRCVRCARHNAVTLEQQMGPLPAVRTRPARPFSFTGVDFAGPFYIRCSPGRGQKAYKGYVALFICMVVRAVHLEVVSDLTSAAFLAAFRRFVARRGLCKVMYSDHGRNFRGADAELHRLFAETSAISQEIAVQIARDGVEWTYIPPRAPNFGGLWEANIKSFKRHLTRVVGESRLTFEEFSTVVTMIEACLNSRPLSSLSTTEEDVIALTPGHFLIGAPLSSPAEPFIETNETQSPSSRWHLLTLMRNHFWKRWHREFLAQMQQRAKWLYPNNSLKIGDVVLFRDELLPPTKWPLGRIVKLHPGADGLSRVARIKTAMAEYTRSINKLILLPINDTAAVHLAGQTFTAGGDASPPPEIVIAS